MRPDVLEWIYKAEGDFKTASRELSYGTESNYDAVCFHAQQCCEKYLKALLTEHNEPFPKLHDLEALLNLLSSEASCLEGLRACMRRLTAMAVEVRYPGYQADEEDAHDALACASMARDKFRQILTLPID